MELSDFDKCEMCINCKITQQTIYNIKKVLILGFEPLSYHYSSKKIYPTCMCALPTKPRNRLKFQCDINYFVIIIPLICIKPHVPIFSIVQSTFNGIIEQRYGE